MAQMKFRAWQDNQMLIQQTPGIYGTKAFLDKLYEDCDLMQATGFRDRNSTEIFDGDVLESAKGRFLIGYKDGAFIRTTIFIYGEQGEKIPMERILDPIHTLYNTLSLHTCLIIGNRFENPELLQL
ncbi:MAG: YopX family protein [Thiotrichales bacterium]